MLRLTKVGAACEAPGCTQHDFIPWRCEACTRSFCNEHARRDKHACAAPVPATRQLPGPSPRATSRSPATCAVCSGVAIMRCDQCGRSSCVPHRHHRCENESAALRAIATVGAATAPLRALAGRLQGWGRRSVEPLLPPVIRNELAPVLVFAALSLTLIRVGHTSWD
jgi:hypothetical protein